MQKATRPCGLGVCGKRLLTALQVFVAIYDVNTSLGYPKASSSQARVSRVKLRATGGHGSLVARMEVCSGGSALHVQLDVCFVGEPSLGWFQRAPNKHHIV